MSDPNVIMIDGQRIDGPDFDEASDERAVSIFEALQATWRWGPEITEYILQVICLRNIYDFVAEFRQDAAGMAALEGANLKIKTEREIGGVVFKVNAAIPRAYYARVRQAAEKSLKAQKRAADLDQKGTTEDMEEVAKTETINEWKQRFWNRHHVSIPYTKTPSNQLLSRLKKELDHRRIQVLDMKKVKGLAFEKRTTKEHRDMGAGITLSLAPTAVEEDRPETVEQYLEALEMYLLALAIAGSTKLTNPPKIAGVLVQETATTEPSEYVEFPWQFSWNYMDRAVQYVKSLPHDLRYVMLKLKDTAERQKWTEKYPLHTDKTLGQIATEIHAHSERHWEFTPADRAQALASIERTAGNDAGLRNTITQLKRNLLSVRGRGMIGQRGRGAPKKAAAKKKAGKSKKSKGKSKGDRRSKGGGQEDEGPPQTVASMSDGTELCRDWNEGRCQRTCSKRPKQAHRCNGKIGQNRACAESHRSINCEKCWRR
jgi:hypothetical protein